MPLDFRLLWLGLALLGQLLAVGVFALAEWRGLAWGKKAGLALLGSAIGLYLLNLGWVTVQLGHWPPLTTAEVWAATLPLMLGAGVYLYHQIGLRRVVTAGLFGPVLLGLVAIWQTVAEPVYLGAERWWLWGAVGRWLLVAGSATLYWEAWVGLLLWLKTGPEFGWAAMLSETTASLPKTQLSLARLSLWLVSSGTVLALGFAGWQGLLTTSTLILLCLPWPVLLASWWRRLENARYGWTNLLLSWLAFILIILMMMSITY